MTMLRHSTLLSNAATFLLWIGAIAVIFSTIYATVLVYNPVPYMDEWNSTIYFYKLWLEGNESKLTLLFDQHNEHRITTAKLIFLADCKFSSCNNKIAIPFIFFSQLLLASTLFLLYIKATGQHGNQKWLVIPFILMCVFSWMQEENFTWGFQVQFVGVYFFSVAALYLLALSSQNATKLYSNILFTASIILALSAVFTMANGILIFSVLFVYAFLIKISLNRKIIILSTAIISACLYFTDYHGNPGHADPWVSLTEHPLDIVQYTCTYLGGIFKHGFALPDPLNQFAGFLYLGVFSYYLIKHFFIRSLNTYQLALLGIAGFILLTAMLTSLGRLNFGYEQAYAGRYATPVLIGWSALALVAFNTYVSHFIVIFLVMAIISYQINYPYREDKRVIERQLGLLSLMVGSRDNDALRKIFPDPNFPANMAIFLEQHDYSFYQLGYQDYLGKILDEQFQREEDSACLGTFDNFQLSPEISNGAAVSGWSWIKSDASPAKFIVLTNPDKKIIGLAIQGNHRKDVSLHYPIPPYKIGWQGYVKKAPGTIKAYAVFPDKQRICALKGSKNFPSSQLQASKENYLPNQQYTLKASEAWAINAFFPTISDFPKTKNVMQKTDIWASWNGSDYNTGILRIGPIDSALIESIILPIITGPVTTKQQVRLIAQDGIQILDIIDIPVNSQAWNYYKIKISPELDLNIHSSIYIDFHDNGSQYGEWFAVALPKQIQQKK